MFSQAENKSERNKLSQLQEVTKRQQAVMGQEKRKRTSCKALGEELWSRKPSKYKSIKQLDNKHLALEEGTGIRSDKYAHNSFTLPFQQEALCLLQLRKTSFPPAETFRATG